MATIRKIRRTHDIAYRVLIRQTNLPSTKIRSYKENLIQMTKRYPASSINWCITLNAARYSFCEYTEFNNLKDVKPFYYK